MKTITKLSLAFLFLAFSYGNAQQSMLMSESGNNNTTGLINIRPYEATAIEGERYINDIFLPATVSTHKGTYLMRYDVANDDMEFKKGEGQIFVLNKTPDADFSVTFNGGKDKYVLSKYTDKNGAQVFGYLKQITDLNSLTLYKRERINLVPAKIAKTSYEDSKPAKYKRGEDEFYLKKADGVIVDFPNNKKKLLAAYPDKKKEIEDFLKKSDPSFKSEQGLTQIIRFIATL